MTSSPTPASTESAATTRPCFLPFTRVPASKGSTSRSLTPSRVAWRRVAQISPITLPVNMPAPRSAPPVVRAAFDRGQGLGDGGLGLADVRLGTAQLQAPEGAVGLQVDQLDRRGLLGLVGGDGHVGRRVHLEDVE